MKMKNVLTNVTISLIVTLTVVGLYNYFGKDHETPAKVIQINDPNAQSIRLAKYDALTKGNTNLADFTLAAEISTPAVVHVKNFYSEEINNYDPFSDFWGDFFGRPRPPQNQKRQAQASGSGVIISSDGYMVTNNHVINNADKLEVTLYNNKTYPATLIGTDPSTDIALIKIDEEGLPFMRFGNSDSSIVGQWVLAVGNPFDLTSTVTAGIISAKGRNINILREQSRAPIESFIQTDAAVNPGNSGGALVNLRGELIGINTAIATPTGTYAGYSFAVPVNIVKKVVKDLKEYGVVQRAFLGVSIRDIDQELAEELDLHNYQGAYILNVSETSGADDAGLKEGDIITNVNKTAVNSVAELQEQISMYRPGEQVNIQFIRNDEVRNAIVTLKNKLNNTEVIEKESIDYLEVLGASFEDLDSDTQKELDISGGVRVTDIQNGKISANTSMRDGFIITRIDHERVRNVKELMEILNKKDKGEGVLLEGFYPFNPNKTYYYAFGM
jgi:serine protease Do